MSTTVARRYAQALSELASRDGVTEQVDADVELVRAALASSRDLGLFFRSPVISRDKKKAVVSALFSDRVHRSTLQFLLLLVEKRREDQFGLVTEAYSSLRDEQQGVVEAHVRSAHELDAEDVSALRASLERITGKNVRLATGLDASLLGGLVVRVGDTVYDGSIKGRFASLRERLAAGAALAN